MDLSRKPLARMESKDERITFRVSFTLKEILAAAALEEGEELSRYVRACVLTGHTVKQSQKLYKATLG